MISETSWLPLPSCSAISPSTFDGAGADRLAGDAEGVADLVADPAADLVLQPRGGLEPLDQRAPLEVGQHAVELVGDLLELGQQVLLLLDGLVDLLLGGASSCGLLALGLAVQGGHRAT